LSKLWSAARFTPWLVIVPVHIVMESAADRSPFLLLPPFQDLFSSAEVKIRWRHVAPPFVAPAVVVRLDELRHGRSQSLRLVNTSRFSRALSVSWKHTSFPLV